MKTRTIDDVPSRPHESRYVQPYIGAFCQPWVGGSRPYLMMGHIKYVDHQGQDTTFRIAIQENYARPATCPREVIRRVREANAFLALSRFNPNNASDQTDQSAGIWLGAQLKAENGGSLPYVPTVNGKKPKYAWEAHHIIPKGERGAVRTRALAFRCRVHPNETENGVYQRGRGLRKTRGGVTTEVYKALKRDSPALAKYAFHLNAKRPAYFERLAAIVDETYAREFCGGSAAVLVRSALDDVKGHLKTSTLGHEAPEEKP